MKQIIVTKRGQGIIPRALAHGKSIKFTRVCISDKDYTDVELCNLESIESVKQEVNVDCVHIINDTQVEVVCGVDNEKLNDAYYIRTIGIYAEDIDGNEILYGVSISDDVPKYMPKYEGKTLTGILYRLTINIDNADNVITDINNATVANVLEVQLIEKRVTDVEKRVTDAEKKSNEIEKRVSTVEDTTTQIATSNLLINGNFDVWQRGHNDRPDMFKPFFEGGADGNVKRLNANTKNNCLSWQITKGGTSSNIRYYFSKEDYYKFQDKWIALTVEVEATNDCPCFTALFDMGPVDTSNQTSRTFTIKNERKRYTTFFKLTDVTQGSEVGHIQVIRLNSTGYTGTIKVYSVEMVEVASPTIELVPKVIKTTYNQELKKCQYYLQKIQGLGLIGVGLVTAITATASYAIVNIPLSSNMRINYPMLTYNNVSMEFLHRPELETQRISNLRFAPSNVKNGMAAMDIGVNITTGLSVGDPVMMLLNTDDYILLSAEL